MIAQAFATMACLSGPHLPGSGHRSLNEIATGYVGEWPEFKERTLPGCASRYDDGTVERGSGRFRWRVLQAEGASIYDVPEGGVPVYIAAGGPGAEYAGRAGDGFIAAHPAKAPAVPRTS